MIELPVSFPSPRERMRKSIEADCGLNVRERIRAIDGMLVVIGPSGVPIDCLKAVIPVFHCILERARPESFGKTQRKITPSAPELKL